MTFTGIDLASWWLILQIVGYILGTGIVGTIFTWCYKTYTRVSRTFTFVENLEKELKPNGGSTLRDAIDYIKSDIRQMKFVQLTHLDYTEKTPMFVSDSDGGCVWVNKAYVDLTGKSVHQVLGFAWEAIIDERDRVRVREEWERCVEEEIPFDLTYNCINDDGKHIPVRCKASGSKKTGFVGFITKLPKSQI